MSTTPPYSSPDSSESIANRDAVTPAGRDSGTYSSAEASAAEDLRETLISANTCLSLYVGIQCARTIPGTPDWWPWDRIGRVLFEALADLQNPVPAGKRLVSRALLLSMISDGLDLLQKDRDFHFLLSVYMQSCVLISLMNTESASGEFEGFELRAFNDRIRTSLEFITVELAELGRRHSRSVA